MATVPSDGVRFGRQPTALLVPDVENAPYCARSAQYMARWFGQEAPGGQLLGDASLYGALIVATDTGACVCTLNACDPLWARTPEAAMDQSTATLPVKLDLQIVPADGPARRIVVSPDHNYACVCTRSHAHIFSVPDAVLHGRAEPLARIDMQQVSSCSWSSDASPLLALVGKPGAASAAQAASVRVRLCACVRVYTCTGDQVTEISLPEAASSSDASIPVSCVWDPSGDAVLVGAESGDVFRITHTHTHTHTHTCERVCGVPLVFKGAARACHFLHAMSRDSFLVGWRPSPLALAPDGSVNDPEELFHVCAITRTHGAPAWRVEDFGVCCTYDEHETAFAAGAQEFSAASVREWDVCVIASNMSSRAVLVASRARMEAERPDAQGYCVVSFMEDAFAPGTLVSRINFTNTWALGTAVIRNAHSRVPAALVGVRNEDAPSLASAPRLVVLCSQGALLSQWIVGHNTAKFPVLVPVEVRRTAPSPAAPPPLATVSVREVPSNSPFPVVPAGVPPVAMPAVSAAQAQREAERAPASLEAASILMPPPSMTAAFAMDPSSGPSNAAQLLPMPRPLANVGLPSPVPTPQPSLLPAPAGLYALSTVGRSASASGAVRGPSASAALPPVASAPPSSTLSATRTTAPLPATRPPAVTRQSLVASSHPEATVLPVQPRAPEVQQAAALLASSISSGLDPGDAKFAELVATVDAKLTELMLPSGTRTLVSDADASLIMRVAEKLTGQGTPSLASLQQQASSIAVGLRKVNAEVTVELRASETHLSALLARAKADMDAVASRNTNSTSWFEAPLDPASATACTKMLGAVERAREDIAQLRTTVRSLQQAQHAPERLASAGTQVAVTLKVVADLLRKARHVQGMVQDIAATTDMLCHDYRVSKDVVHSHHSRTGPANDSRVDMSGVLGSPAFSRINRSSTQTVMPASASSRVQQAAETATADVSRSLFRAARLATGEYLHMTTGRGVEHEAARLANFLNLSVSERKQRVHSSANALWATQGGHVGLQFAVYRRSAEVPQAPPQPSSREAVMPTEQPASVLRRPPPMPSIVETSESQTSEEAPTRSTAPQVSMETAHVNEALEQLARSRVSAEAAAADARKTVTAPVVPASSAPTLSSIPGGGATVFAVGAAPNAVPPALATADLPPAMGVGALPASRTAPAALMSPGAARNTDVPGALTPVRPQVLNFDDASPIPPTQARTRSRFVDEPANASSGIAPSVSTAAATVSMPATTGSPVKSTGNDAPAAMAVSAPASILPSLGGATTVSVTQSAPSLLGAVAGSLGLSTAAASSTATVTVPTVSAAPAQTRVSSTHELAQGGASLLPSALVPAPLQGAPPSVSTGTLQTSIVTSATAPAPASAPVPTPLQPTSATLTSTQAAPNSTAPALVAAVTVTAPAASLTVGSAAVAPAAAVPSNNNSVDAQKAALRRYFETHKPENVSKVDDLWTKYGNEIWVKLEKARPGSTVAFAPTIPSLGNVGAPVPTPLTAASPGMTALSHGGLGGVLAAANPAAVRALQAQPPATVSAPTLVGSHPGGMMSVLGTQLGANATPGLSAAPAPSASGDVERTHIAMLKQFYQQVQPENATEEKATEVWRKYGATVWSRLAKKYGESSVSAFTARLPAMPAVSAAAAAVAVPSTSLSTGFRNIGLGGGDTAASRPFTGGMMGGQLGVGAMPAAAAAPGAAPVFGGVALPGMVAPPAGVLGQMGLGMPIASAPARLGMGIGGAAGLQFSGAAPSFATGGGVNFAAGIRR